MKDEIRKFKWVLILVVFFGCSAFVFISYENRIDEHTMASLTLVPPSPITNKVKLDIRG